MQRINAKLISLATLGSIALASQSAIADSNAASNDAPLFKGGISLVEFDHSTEEYVLKLAYTGGCEDHKFALRLEPCRETHPAQCSASLVHVQGSGDTCKKLIEEEVRLKATVPYETFYMQVKGEYASSQRILVSDATPTLDYPVFNGKLLGATYDRESGKFDVELAYAGGLKKHEFALELTDCQETYPAGCSAMLMHVKGADDPAEMWIRRTVELELPGGHPYDYYSLNINSTTQKVRLLIDVR